MTFWINSDLCQPSGQHNSSSPDSTVAISCPMCQRLHRLPQIIFCDRATRWTNRDEVCRRDADVRSTQIPKNTFLSLGNGQLYNFSMAQPNTDRLWATTIQWLCYGCTIYGVYRWYDRLDVADDLLLSDGLVTLVDNVTPNRNTRQSPTQRHSPTPP